MAALADVERMRLPVKNTFIHFDEAEAPLRNRRALRRWRTDTDGPMAAGTCRASSTGGTPEAEPLSCALTSEDAVGARAACSPTSSPIMGSRRPSGLCRLDLPLSSDGSTDVASTPEHTPRLCSARGWPSSGGSATPEGFELRAAEQIAFGTPGAPFFQPRTPAPPSPYGMGSFPMPKGSQPQHFDGGVSFAFTLRLADNHGLGIDLAPLEFNSTHLLVRQILPHGAIEAWNKQCLDGSPGHVKAIRPGDAIVSVNDHTDALDMLEQCREEMLLKLVVVRRTGTVYGFCGHLQPDAFAWQGFHGPCLMPSDYLLSCGVPICNASDSERLHSCKQFVQI